ncbi:hypothetical protein GJ496_008994 [Pomphorhynchus laevis]|nr:hypothetical protein GJ496_008994 [Pomphorhynchus laevis]
MVTSTLPFAISGAGEVAKMAESPHMLSLVDALRSDTCLERQLQQQKRRKARDKKTSPRNIYEKHQPKEDVANEAIMHNISIKTNKNNRKNIASNTIASSLPYTA